MPLDNWGTPLRDVLTEADVRLAVGDINAKLQAFLESEGAAYRRPYAELIAKAGGAIAPNRLETYKKLFEDLGLIFISGGKVNLSELGQVLTSSLSSVAEKVKSENVRIATAAAAVLGRYQLRNPTTHNRDYPADCDVLPYRAIWSALSQLGSLHWEELHRVLLRVMRSQDLPAAIQTIRTARETAGYDPQDPSSASQLLGPAVYQDSDQATRRMTPWFSAAGFGGLLIDREPADGRRSLTEIGKEVVAGELRNQVGWHDFGADRDAWFAYLDDAVSSARTPSGSEVIDAPLLISQISDDDPVLSEVRKLLSDDQASGILFVGPPGTGKSWYARQIAIKLCGGRREALREVQFHPAYQYEDFVEGYIPAIGGGFVLADKHLLEMAAIADASNEPVVLVIDELTRTDPSRVMGEVLTYMERSLRGIEFRLPSGRAVKLPANLVFLATANLEDRSVDELDAAMERRWSKILLSPDIGRVAAFLAENGMIQRDVTAISNFFNAIQELIPLGHAYFRKVSSAAAMERLWTRQILPQLQSRHRYEPAQLAAAIAVWDACRDIISAPPAAAENAAPQ